MCEVSFTGLVSTREPGKKALIPVVITVNPPLTFPVTVPVIKSPAQVAAEKAAEQKRM